MINGQSSKWTVFQISVSHSSKLIESKEGVVGTSDLQHRGNLHLLTWCVKWVERQGTLVGLSIYLCDLMPAAGRQCQNAVKF